MTLSLEYKKIFVFGLVLVLASIFSFSLVSASGPTVRGVVGGVGFCAGPNGGALVIPGLGAIAFGDCARYGGSWSGPIPQYIPPGDTNAPVQDVNQLLGFLVWVVNLAQAVFWILTVGFGLYAAYLYLTSGGSKEKVSQAHKMLTYTVIAAIVAILAYSIPRVVDSFFR